MNLTLEDVTISHVTQQTPVTPESKFSSGADNNLSRCIDAGSHGHQNVLYFHMIDSRISDCAGDAIGSIVNGSASRPQAPTRPGGQPTDCGDGVGDSFRMDIENSVISGTQQYALHFMNQTTMNELQIKIVDSQFSNAQGAAVIAFDQNGSTKHSEIDLGGLGSESPGRNCITAGTNLAIEVTGYDVSAKSNWWGRAGGPLKEKVSVSDGKLDLLPALRVPPACKATK